MSCGAEPYPTPKSQERLGVSPYWANERELIATGPDSASLGLHFSADLHPLLGEVPPRQ
jgi:hypothetical protein